MFRIVFYAVLAVFLVALGSRHTAHNCGPQRTGTSDLERVFGMRVGRSIDVFNINRDYVAKVEFDSANSIASIHIFPKTWLKECDPEFENAQEPRRFSQEEYLVLLDKVKRLRDLGESRKLGTVGVITNMRGTAVDEYAEAFITRTVIPIGDESNPYKELVHSFSIYFMRVIEGTVESKNFFSLSGEYELTLNGQTYLTSAQEYDKAKLGTNKSIKAAGPLRKADFFCSAP